MSGSNNEIANTGGPASSAEPSMEEILASIRRILKDDTSAAQPGTDADEDMLLLDSTMVVKPGTGMVANPETGAAHEAEPSPLYLQPEPIEAQSAFEPEVVAASYQDDPHLSSELPNPEASDLESPDPELKDFETGPATMEMPYGINELKSNNFNQQAETAAGNYAMEEPSISNDSQHNLHPPEGLVSDSTSQAAAGSIGALIRSISSDRQIAIGRAGLTLEDLVREELRPLLKSWLDSNLPLLVERIVRAEIQRVIERSSV